MAAVAMVQAAAVVARVMAAVAAAMEAVELVRDAAAAKWQVATATIAPAPMLPLLRKLAVATVIPASSQVRFLFSAGVL